MASRSDLIRAVRELPVQSTVAMRAFQLLNDPTTSAKDIGSVLATDPSLLVNLLRLANSPMLGRRSRVRDPAVAITVVGFTSVRALVATRVTGMAQPGPEWQHALTTGAAASVLSMGTAIPRAEAFSVGLLHDIGRAVQLQLQGQLLLPREVHAVVSLKEERRRNHLDHTEFGQLALESLGFPPDVIDAVASHHDEVGVAGRPLAAIVCAANHLAHVVDDPTPPPLRLELLDTALSSLGYPVGAKTDALAELTREEAGRWAEMVVTA